MTILIRKALSRVVLAVGLVFALQTPAFALTEAEVINQINQRVIELQAEIAAAQAIVNNPASTAGDVVDAQAAIQFALARVNQADSIIALINLPFPLPEPALMNISDFFGPASSPA